MDLDCIRRSPNGFAGDFFENEMLLSIIKNIKKDIDNRNWDDSIENVLWVGLSELRRNGIGESLDRDKRLLSEWEEIEHWQ